jgi:UDP-N-acetylmuramate: L-alanyl-gamma-D-glutamyl-meso-diaminopimelate ligase
MKLHILGICGTFMGGIAALARELGHQVEGSDANVYPPMSTQLEALGITLAAGYAAEYLVPPPDQVIIGNALSRGNPAVEHVLDARLPYRSGPQWLGEHVLGDRQVLAVAGTHGKTTTTSLLAWLLEAQGCAPGFLIGGVPGNFERSARVGSGPFVIEADEYDTAFFDKRSKFVHYRPSIAILNNLEFDHADIFPDLAAIERQFHHLVRIVPGNGRLIVNAEDRNLARVLAMGCWTPVDSFGIDAGDWRAHLLKADGSVFRVSHRGTPVGEARWSLVGRHNVMNALAALAAVHAAGGSAAEALTALEDFASVKRRLERLDAGTDSGITVYDDFAHHPTAIATTLEGLRARVGDARILAAVEPRSNSMRLGVHADELAPSLRDADRIVFLQRPELPWDAQRVIAALDGRGQAAASVDALLDALAAIAQPGDHVVFMSNGGFEGAPRRFAAQLRG